MSDSIPKEIYLQVCPEHGVFCGDDVTWCVDQINDTDICYINEADLTALRRRAELADGLAGVLYRLDAFQHTFEKNTFGNKMPGNEYYSSLLMSIVADARAALAAYRGKS